LNQGEKAIKNENQGVGGENIDGIKKAAEKKREKNERKKRPKKIRQMEDKGLV
jgi:hypothetical protein